MTKKVVVARIHAQVDRYLAMIAVVLDILETMPVPEAVSQTVDTAARLDALGKRLERLCKEYKDVLWANCKDDTLPSKYELIGNSFSASLLAVESHRFDSKTFGADHPKLYKKYQKTTLSLRTLFKSKG